MKTLLLNVPQWYPMNPYLSTALLAGQLKKRGHQVRTLDLNIEFFNDILTRESVLSSIEMAKSLLPSLEKEYISCTEPEKNFFSYSKEKRTQLLRYREITKFFAANIDYQSVADNVEASVAVLKDKEDFYDPEKHFRAKDCINDALKIISLPYAPARIMIDNYISDAVMTYNFADVTEQCTNGSLNMFIPYFEKKFPSIPLDGVDLVGISMTDLSQLIPALTLGRMIKEKTGKRVALGGNYVFKIREEIKDNPDFFRLFCDYVSVGDGETAFVELCDYIDGKIPLKDVHSLITTVDSRVIVTEDAPVLNLDEISYPDFDDFDFSKYFSADIVLPVQLGKGCYWGKCKFCDFYTGQQKFDIKSVKRAVDEVEYLTDRYGVHNFIFVDEAVPPLFYDKFATELLERKIKINFYSFARFDKGFTKEVLINLQNAGAKFFSWGYETASPRLLDLMNKGIEPSVRDRIIKDSFNIGMWMQCTFLLGYPTETPDELQQTIDVIEDRRFINSCTPSNFALKKNAILKDETGDVGITDCASNGDFHVSMSYHADSFSMESVKKNRMDFERRFLNDTADSLWSLGFTDTDHLLLYLARYGRDYVRDYRLSYRKKV